ncbi:Uma2 family endonuclease [Spirulina major CS-329]|uniref:Uma2 family endonuclease n=1 Tax=Spirulina TaxID=1154 RepID=UPI00232F7B80|nr:MULTISPECIES: Uma2 family endonuclease [Spirulina]MDB9495401.1 Uma2 family endonuclease [Spirulina subsalsa CS-330]MDB9501946.1 Uma2 family endonuclease [Spirulina major CS-329]
MTPPTTANNLNTPEVWVPELPPTDLIFDDGVPLESNRHRLAMNVLIDSVYAALKPREDFYAGGNMFVYYSLAQIKNRDFRGPDFFVALNVDGKKERQGWVIWEEDGKYPDVIVELMSPSTATVDLTAKKEIYEQRFSTSHYFVFDPFDSRSLQGWALQNGQYVALQPNDQGWLWCESLGLWLGTWYGPILQETTDWLRFYFPNEQLVLLPREREYERAEQAEAQAQQERQRAEQERIRAEQAEAQVQQERQQKEALRAKLRELGVDPDGL